jgi:hypothetical protein
MIEFDNTLGQIFQKQFSKILRGKAAQHLNGCLDPGRKGQKRKFRFYIDTCDSTLGQIFQ